MWRPGNFRDCGWNSTTSNDWKVWRGGAVHITTSCRCRGCLKSPRWCRGVRLATIPKSANKCFTVKEKTMTVNSWIWQSWRGRAVCRYILSTRISPLKCHNQRWRRMKQWRLMMEMVPQAGAIKSNWADTDGYWWRPVPKSIGVISQGGRRRTALPTTQLEIVHWKNLFPASGSERMCHLTPRMGFFSSFLDCQTVRKTLASSAAKKGSFYLTWHVKAILSFLQFSSTNFAFANFYIIPSIGR